MTVTELDQEGVLHLKTQTEPEDHGSGARRRRFNTTRPIGIGTADWRKLTKAQREEILEHVPSQAASSSSGPQIAPVADSPVVSVPAVSTYSPVVTIVGGVHAKMRSRQTKQQPNNEETSDVVACQKVKATERTIGTIIKPAIKKTDHVERNIVEGKTPRLVRASANEIAAQSPDLHSRMT